MWWRRRASVRRTRPARHPGPRRCCPGAGRHRAATVPADRSWSASRTNAALSNEIRWTEADSAVNRGQSRSAQLFRVWAGCSDRRDRRPDDQCGRRHRRRVDTMAQDILCPKEIHDDPDAIDIACAVAAEGSCRSRDLLVGGSVRPRGLPEKLRDLLECGRAGEVPGIAAAVVQSVVVKVGQLRPDTLDDAGRRPVAGPRQQRFHLVDAEHAAVVTVDAAAGEPAPADQEYTVDGLTPSTLATCSVVR